MAKMSISVLFNKFKCYYCGSYRREIVLIHDTRECACPHFVCPDFREVDEDGKFICDQQQNSLEEQGE